MLESRGHIRMYMEVRLRFLPSWPSVTGFMTVWLFHVKRRARWLFLLYQWLGIGGLLMECFTWNMVSCWWGGDWSALFSFTGCCGGVWCFTWNIDTSVDNEAYSSLGKTIYISRWRIGKSMSASLVFLAPRSRSCVGALNKLHGFTWNAVG